MVSNKAYGGLTSTGIAPSVDPLSPSSSYCPDVLENGSGGQRPPEFQHARDTIHVHGITVR